VAIDRGDGRLRKPPETDASISRFIALSRRGRFSVSRATLPSFWRSTVSNVSNVSAVEFILLTGAAAFYNSVSRYGVRPSHGAGILGSTIHGTLRDAWQIMGDRISVRDGNASWSGRGLLQRADVIRDGLVELGIVRDEPVLVFVSNIAADFAALLAVWEAGGVVVPVHRASRAGVVAPLLQATASRFQVDGRLST
jgi:hypothetical protein